MAYEVPSVAEFQRYFVRDFPYGATSDKVMNSDICKAIAEASFNINEALFTTQEKFTIAYLYLTAHYLVMDLRASSQGIAGQYTWLSTSRTVGSVSESFGIPPKILENPYFAGLSKTTYGGKFLSLILPSLVAQTFFVCGRTSP